MEFDGSQKIIGRGAQADVIEYYEYAYKLYKNTYPSEWIAFEKDQQKAVNMAGLSPIRYYDTDDDHMIKMDLIRGVMLETKMKEGFEGGFDTIAEAFRRIHNADISNINMPRMIDTLRFVMTEEECAKAAPVIEHLSEKYKSCICHLDMHFQNIMIPDDGSDFIIIDWMNTRIAPPVFDFARTYVVIEEFVKELIPLYRSAIAEDVNRLGITEQDMDDAIGVIRIIRNHEKE
ncbi:MAG: aminoglycoside phosphotransferase family protein [Clostridia bacterium]|nr:aminoglycoside phosphotransferase family protein [Clostridia bacterium]